MDLYTKNIEALTECTLGNTKAIKKLQEVQYSQDTVKEIDGCLHMVVEGIDYQMESQNPEKEAELLVKGIDWKKENLILVLGIGNRALLKELSKHKDEGSKIIIYEPNAAVLKYRLETEDMTDLLIPGTTLVWWGLKTNADRKRQTLDVSVLNWYQFIYNIQIVTCPAYQAYLEEFKQVFLEIKNKIYQNYAIMGNCLEDMLQGFHQNAANLLPCMESNSLKEIVGKYQDIPAIIVSAGPSLEKNIQYLKEAQGKALIIACDASLNACLQHGVKPDAIATIEREEATYNFYYKGKTFDKDLVLLAPSLIWDKIYQEYPGKKIVISKNNEGVEGWWLKFFPNVTYFNTGMSCATLAYGVALNAGCNPVVLIGQDLAYTDNKKHSSFTHTEMEGENSAEESDGLMVEDIYGNMVLSDTIYNLFRLWFEEQISRYPDTLTIDATEGGAKIHGAKIMTLKDTINTYCIKDKGKNMVDYLSDVTVTPQQIYDKCKEIDKSAGKLIRKLYQIKKKAEQHYETLEKIYDQIEDDTTEQQLVKMVRKMEKGNDIIVYVNSQRELFGFFQQYIAQTVNHVKALGNELTPVNVFANLKLQGNLMGALKRMASLLIHEFEDVQKEMRRQMEATGITEQ